MSTLYGFANIFLAIKKVISGTRVVNKISIKVYDIYWFDLYIFKVYTAKPIHVQKKQYRQPYIIIAFLYIDECK